ncbi:MAG TPA: cell division protein ZapB [Roseateles sp.]|jgi:cell division protein ZapB|nr:cell division protein ZapB [Roseateles sp.]HWT54456.1 cell division protein ZapB [Rhodocyclaceae bacterium]
MNTPLDSLENKIDSMLALCERLRDENRALRTQLSALEGVNQTLTNTIDASRARLEALMERLPEE